MTKQKIAYSKLTFILSVIGFIGSLGFYFGVLREVYSTKKDSQKIEQLQAENQRLKDSVFCLIQKMNNDEKDD